MQNLFRQKLLQWYRLHGRDLPWRHTHDPYRILIAEVMLQQTQVSTVVERYQCWLKQFPTVDQLAKASPREVLKEWSGLGYNRRALMLHQISKQIVNNHAGAFPNDIKILMKFKGIGQYTAHALAAFAFRQPVPLVDTNIKRVLGRVLLGYKILAQQRNNNEVFWNLSKKFIHSSRSVYDVNQGLMDFGALVCTAKHPNCVACPLNNRCKSYPDILTAETEHLRVKARHVEPQYFGQPRRIWRGKILQFLHTQPKGATVSMIGQTIQADWVTDRTNWLNTVIDTMVKDKLVVRKLNKIKVAD